MLILCILLLFCEINVAYEGWYNVSVLYPNAKIRASSFDNFFNALDQVRDLLPVRNFEVGDTWTYGIPSDPRKMREYKIISQQRTDALSKGKVSGEFLF